MEIVDKFDNKRTFIEKTGERYDKIKGEYMQSVHTWIVNDNNEFLMQKRSSTKKNYPNLWSQTGGAVDSGETTLEATLRECKEELGIEFSKDKVELILSFKREFDFVDVFLIKANFSLNDVTIQKEELSEVKWMTEKEIKSLQENNMLAPSINMYFDMFLRLIKTY